MFLMPRQMLNTGRLDRIDAGTSFEMLSLIS